MMAFPSFAEKLQEGQALASRSFQGAPTIAPSLTQIDSMKRKWFLASFALIVLCSGIISYVYFSKDYSESRTSTETRFDENGKSNN
nr:hypothetical protein [uncultured Psychroserpens sp.]